MLSLLKKTKMPERVDLARRKSLLETRLKQIISQLKPSQLSPKRIPKLKSKK